MQFLYLWNVETPSIKLRIQKIISEAVLWCLWEVQTWEEIWSTRRIFRLFMWTLRSSSSTALSRSSWLVSGITNCKRKEQLWCRCPFIIFGSMLTPENVCLWSLQPPYLIVSVMKVHRLAKSHFSFRPQVVQLDRSRELQDPTGKNKGQRGKVTGLHWQHLSGEPGPCLTSSPLWTRTSLWHRSVEKTLNSATDSFYKSENDGELLVSLSINCLLNLIF